MEIRSPAIAPVALRSFSWPLRYFFCPAGLPSISTFDSQSASNGIDRTHQVLSSIDGLLSRLLDAESGARGYLLTGGAPFLAPYAAAEPRVATASAELVALVADDPLQRERAQRLADLSRDAYERASIRGRDVQAGRTTESGCPDRIGSRPAADGSDPRGRRRHEGRRQRQPPAAGARGQPRETHLPRVRDRHSAPGGDTRGWLPWPSIAASNVVDRHSSARWPDVCARRARWCRRHRS